MLGIGFLLSKRDEEFPKKFMMSFLIGDSVLLFPSMDPLRSSDAFVFVSLCEKDVDSKK